MNFLNYFVYICFSGFYTLIKQHIIDHMRIISFWYIILRNKEIQKIKKLNSEIVEHVQWERKYEMYLESLSEPQPPVKKAT